MRTRIETQAYFSAHLKMPRGFARWAFCPTKELNKPNYLEHVFWCSGKYAEAKKQAIAHFNGKALYVSVCP